MTQKNTIKPFIPSKLPPKGVDYNSIIRDISTTRESIARYDESLKRLPNPEIVQHSFETKEAVLSSKIEGTQVTLDEVLELDAEEKKGEKTNKEKDYREVVNYRKAIREGQKMLSKKPLSENVIKKLHKTLLDSVRGQKKAPGQFRKIQAFIGSPGSEIEDARYIPPSPQNIVPLFSDLVKYINSDNVPDPVVQIAVSHYQFEAIHSFLDGNGRVGRIIIPLFLYDKGITEFPSIYISEFFENNRQEYYNKLKAVSSNGEWTKWIKFFLKGLRTQTKITGDRVEEIENLYNRLMNRAADFNSIYTHKFIEAIFKKPKFKAQTIKDIAEIKHHQTLYNLIEKFLEEGILVDETPNKKRNKIYSFRKLLNIVN